MKTSYHFEKALEKCREAGVSEEKIKELEDYSRSCFSIGNGTGYMRGLFWGGGTLMISAAILKVIEVMAYRKAGIK